MLVALYEIETSTQFKSSTNVVWKTHAPEILDRIHKLCDILWMCKRRGMEEQKHVFYTHQIVFD